MKTKVITLALCLLAVFAFAACGGNQEQPGQSILSQDTVNIAEIVVYFDEQGKQPITLDAQEAEALISALGGTKGEEKPVSTEGEQWGSFKYALDIHYADGGVDQLFSDEEGAVFFRFINEDASQLSGRNQEIANILENL